MRKKVLLVFLIITLILLTGCKKSTSSESCSEIHPEVPEPTPPVYTVSGTDNFLSIDCKENIWRQTKYTDSLLCKNTKEDTDTDVWFVLHTEPLTTEERSEVPNSLSEISSILVDSIHNAANFKRTFSSRKNSVESSEEKTIRDKNMQKDYGMLETEYMDGTSEKIKYISYYFQYDEDTIGAASMLVFGKQNENGEFQFDDQQIEKKSQMLDDMILTLRSGDSVH